MVSELVAEAWQPVSMRQQKVVELSVVWVVDRTVVEAEAAAVEVAAVAVAVVVVRLVQVEWAVVVGVDLCLRRGRHLRRNRSGGRICPFRGLYHDSQGRCGQRS